MAYSRAMRVLHVSAELYPWVKSGGLGDVAAAWLATLIAGLSCRSPAIL
jgi:glycogen synthase